MRLPDNNRAESEGKDDVPSLAALSHEVKELVRLISTTDISELHIESGPVRITIKRGGHLGSASHTDSVYTPPSILQEGESSKIINLIGNSPAHGGEVTLNEGEQALVAPLVGTFFTAPAPNAEPYVGIGDIVEPGQTVGIIEAMKMMNEIKAEVAGRITRVLVENAQPVEYGQLLMLIQNT